MLSLASRSTLRRISGKNNIGDEIANAIDFLHFDPWGPQRGRILMEVDLSAISAAKYINLTTIPAGSVIEFMGIQNASNLTASGTSAKIGLGDHTSPTDHYVLTGDLLKNSQDVKYFTGSPLGSDTPVDIILTTSAGTALGSGNFTAGLIVVSIVAKLPPLFPQVP